MTGALAAGAALTAPAIAQAAPRIVVIGGGAGGASTAKLIARNAPTAQVTLVTADPTYTTCFFSNLYLAGLRSLRSITFNYERLASGSGVRVVIDRATAIDREQKSVRLSNQTALPYDRLVLAPGIAFRDGAIEGYDAAATELMPHAWQAGLQTFLLKRRIESMRRGGVFVIAPPGGTYRCPPGPYERASMAALLLKRINPRAKILILDAKDSFAKQPLFEEIWEQDYRKRLEWTPGAMTGGGVQRVDARTGEIELRDGERITADAACIIPPQRAADIVIDSGLADDTGWAPVDPTTLESRFDPSIHVVGDSAALGPVPKSAFAANSQSRVAAQGVVSSLGLGQKFPARYRNTCWSFVAWQQVIKIGATYAVGEETGVTRASAFQSELGETKKQRLASALEANGWYAGITSEMFA